MLQTAARFLLYIFNDQVAEAHICVHINGAFRGFVGLTVHTDAGKAGVLMDIHCKPAGDKDGKFPEAGIHIQLSVFGNCFHTPKVNRIVTKTDINIALLHNRQINAHPVRAEGSIIIKGIFLHIQGLAEFLISVKF